MVPITALVTVIGIVLVFMASPGRALGVLIASMLVWPEYLRIPIGPAEMSAPRLIALVLLVRLLLMGRARRINICSVDWLVFLLWSWTVVATIIAGGNSAQITRMIGQGFDTVLMYFVGRLCIRSVADMKELALPLLIVSAYMCFMGWLESITYHSPYLGLDKYRGWFWFPKDAEFRLGLMRAKVSMSVHIIFGMTMMVVAGIAWSLRGIKRIRKMSIWTAFFAGTAAFSSMSSGPWLGMIFLVICNAYILRPKLIKPTLYFLVAVAILLELSSNRHFYNLIDYLALNSATAWYRTRLLEVAADRWRDYWLVGVGSKSIQYWGALVDGRHHIDLVNHFIVVAVNGGLAAMFFYIFSHVNAIRYAAKVRKISKDNVQRICIFSLVSALIALDLSSLSAGLFGAVLIMSNIMLGMLASVSVAWRTVPAPALNREESPVSDDGRILAKSSERAGMQP